MSAKRVVIGGASGFIGRNLCRELIERGHQVVALSRKPQTLRHDTDGSWTEIVSWNDVEHAVSDCDAVVNLAGVPIVSLGSRWTKQYKNDVVRSRIDSTHALTDAIQKASKKPEVFVCASAVSYYPPSDTLDSKQYDERIVCKPYDFLSELCHQWEGAANNAETQSGVRTVSVRTGVVLGRSGGMIANMFWPFFFGLGGPMGSGRQPLPWIHVHDLVGIYADAIENTNIDGPINGTSPADNTFSEFASEFGRALWRPAILPLPAFFVRAAFGDERAVMFLKGQRCTPRKALENGYEFIYSDLRTACQSVAHIFSSIDETG